ncbi:IclR family transcriptional regulator [Aliiruegeria lutimaris]|uniref:Transcriptional regulator, IclR family n=1 Tax=Aliiruegeria lutimaris TaxID=571298 RepID=A0A1G8JQB0_9RHOB|nr:IclR family transcriptional regulator [Aliiruegeria lutimaris]SDI33375.1 transcriptional regulator, IclR family [Aliiruegeria lutimaris]
MSSAGDGTVGKALDVLDLVAAQEKPIRFAELQRMSVLPKATLYRLAQTLVNQGMLVHNPEGGTYSLGVRLVRLAHAAWRQASLAPIARRHLDSLSVDTGLTVHLAQMDYGHVLYVDKRNALESAAMFSDAGKIAPAYCTGVGKAMLAFLDADELDQILGMQSFHRFTPTTLASEAVLRQSLERTRTRGFATDREEHEAGVICVAMPILSDEGRVLGAASLSGSTLRTDLKSLEAHIPRLRQCVEAIAEEATHWAFPVEGNETGGRLG